MRYLGGCEFWDPGTWGEGSSPFKAFRKTSDRWEFTHASFRRGEKKLLNEIRRRHRFSPTPTGQTANVDTSPTNSSEEQATTSSDNGANSNVSTHMEEENIRLRQENRRLSDELGRMKKVCNNIFNLVSNLNSNGAHKGEAGSSSGPTGPLQLLDLMPTEVVVNGDSGEGSRTKLFGVSIPAAKPSRNGLLGDHMDLDMNPWMCDPGTGMVAAAEPVQPDGNFI